MRSAVCLVLLVVVGLVVAADPDGVTLICSREECTCQERDGLELVTCDCGDASNAQPLLVGDPSQAYVSERTRSLRVRRCGRVSLMSEALSNASRLTDLELSDIGRLELQPSCLYRAGDGPPRRLTVQRVADLRLHPEAFHRVARLQQLELAEVVGELPLGSFPAGAEVGSFRLADSWMGTSQSVFLEVSSAENVTVTNNTFGSLNVRVGDARFVTIADNAFPFLYGMRLNSSSRLETTDTEVTIARNNISRLGVDQLKMTLHRFTLVNNTLEVWTAPLRVTYHMAVLTGNDIGHLGSRVFSKFARVTNVNLDNYPPTSALKNHFFMFTRNTIRGSFLTGGLYGTFLVPTDYEARYMALFRVSGNRFSCICWELKNLVKTGEELLEAQPTDEGLYESPTVHGELYRTSSCLEDGRSLQQYRKDAYTDEFECVPGGAAAAAAAAGTLPLLLAVAAAGVAV